MTTQNLARLNLAMLALLLAASVESGSQTPEKPANASGARVPVVLELFTSEGCSSCPPADALLARLVHESEASGRRVYGLSLHVDYWDRLGWRDRFSNAAYTQRQSQYARRFALQGNYTPEMVVNGDGECVGSNAGAVQVQVDRSLARKSGATPELAVTASGHELRVSCNVAHAPQGATLNVAWVQSRAVSVPDAGENGGRTLEHANVVRDLRTVVLTPGFHDTIVLQRPEVEDGEVIAWVQAANQGSVLGAGSSAVRAPAR